MRVGIAASVIAVCLASPPAVVAAPMPLGLHAPAWWLPQAVCVHEHEGAWNDNTGNGYYGGMQFTLGTWRSVGGSGQPDRATPREQLYRAWLVWKRDGGSWREWSSRIPCGLR